MKCICNYGVRALLVAWQGHRGDHIYLLNYTISSLFIWFTIFYQLFRFSNRIAMLKYDLHNFMKRVGCQKLIICKYLNRKKV